MNCVRLEELLIFIFQPKISSMLAVRWEDVVVPEDCVVLNNMLSIQALQGT